MTIAADAASGLVGAPTPRATRFVSAPKPGDPPFATLLGSKDGAVAERADTSASDPAPPAPVSSAAQRTDPLELLIAAPITPHEQPVSEASLPLPERPITAHPEGAAAAEERQPDDAMPAPVRARATTRTEIAQRPQSTDPFPSHPAVADAATPAAPSSGSAGDPLRPPAVPMQSAGAAIGPARPMRAPPAAVRQTEQHAAPALARTADGMASAAHIAPITAAGFTPAPPRRQAIAGSESAEAQSGPEISASPAKGGASEPALPTQASAAADRNVPFPFESTERTAGAGNSETDRLDSPETVPDATLAEGDPGGFTLETPLADVSVRRSAESGLDVVLRAGKPETLDWLTDRLPQLEAQLAAIGAEVDGLRVEPRAGSMAPPGSDSSGRQAGGSGDQAEARKSSQDHAVNAEHTLSDARGNGAGRSGPGATGTGKVDRYA